MVITDPITDLLACIKNANAIRHEVVEVPSSDMEKAATNVLLQEGYIKELEEHNDSAVPMLRISFKYGVDKKRTVTGIKRTSKPGLKVYCKKDKVPKVLDGLGTTIIPVSTGLLVSRETRKTGLDGGIVCYA